MIMNIKRISLYLEDWYTIIFLFKITINSYDNFEKMPIVELHTGNTKSFGSRPILTQCDSNDDELEICF